MNNENNSPTHSEIPPQSGQAIPDSNRRSKPWDVPLGQIVATRNAHDQLSHNVILLALARHCRGDWGDVCSEDWHANEEAMEIGERLLSSYCSPDGVKFWIITEWDRSITTILLPEDY
jgi:hypothetical protein